MTDLIRTHNYTTLLSGKYPRSDVLRSPILAGDKADDSTTLVGRFVDEDTAEDDGGRLDLDVRGHLKFAYQGTMTQAEVTEKVIDLARRFGARSQCHLIIRSIPDEVIPTVLPQLREMAEYEVRMWQVRQDEIEGGDINERWISLPAAPA